MPGFVDVTGWTAEEVKRLGQIDDEDPRDSNYSHRNLARRNPYGYNKNTYAKPASVKYTVSDVWAAACAAHRVNGGYFKQFVFAPDENGQPQLVKRMNRDVMMHFLANPAELLAEDLSGCQRVRSFLQ